MFLTFCKLSRILPPESVSVSFFDKRQWDYR
jgi:hypothetical protein